MRTILSAVLLAWCVASTAQAQSLVLPDRADPAHVEPARLEATRVDGVRTETMGRELISPRGRVLDRKFWAVAAALNTAMLMDTKSTFDVARACPTCEEANPIVAPFFRKGAAVTFTAGEFFDAGVMTLAARMKGSERVWMRRTWWVVPAALIVGHGIAHQHNVNLLR